MLLVISHDPDSHCADQTLMGDDMKKLLLTAAGLLALCGSAFAADLPPAPPVYKAPPPPAPVYSWTGFYIGVNAGYSFDGSTGAGISGFTDPSAFGFGPPINAIANGATPITSYRTSGFLGGGQLGYNWQVAPSWVVGLETDFMGGSVKGSETVSAQPLCCVLNVTSVTEKLDWLGTTRARFGYAAGPWLFYGTGGAAYGNVENSLGLTLPTNTPPSTLFGVNSSVRGGWAAGGGIEYGWQHWLARIEYLHYDLGSQTVTAPATGVTATTFPGTSLSASQRAAANLVRGAVSYRF
jgi:outer membrane immunogenic protein